MGQVTALPPGTRLWKAHGCGNTFVLFDDREGTLDPTPELVARLCSPLVGIGADGLIRVTVRDGLFFMDYRNGDGSLAEMCGNGVRVFVDHLRRQGWVSCEVGESIEILTRAGTRRVTVCEARPKAALTPVWERGRGDAGARPRVDEAQGGNADDAQYEQWYDVDMGEPSVDSTPLSLTVPGIGRHEALRVAMPNPHAVVVLDTREALAAALLPTVDNDAAPAGARVTMEPALPEGTNIELIVDVTDEEYDGEWGHLLMRVLERGVGETAACGTGCCAAAVAASRQTGRSQWRIDIPGGCVEVLVSQTVHLQGPAARIAEIVLAD